MTKYLLALTATLFMFGCPGDKDDTGVESDADTDTDSDTDADPTFSESWTGSGVNFTVDGGSGTYTLGMAETDAASPDPWTGEDCLNGYTLSSGTVLLYCHPLSSSGGSFTGGGSATALDESSETVFDSTFSSVLTYAAWSDDSGDCWTWGADTSYYTGEGCIEQ